MSGTRSVYSLDNWNKDYKKHKQLSNMISKTSGKTSLEMVARKLRKKILLGEKNKGEALNKETVQLIQSILKRRSKRIKGQSVPQTANPNATRSRPYNREMRPGTSPMINTRETERKDEDAANEFDMPKDALVDYDELSDN